MLLGMVPPTGTRRREQNARNEETVEEHEYVEVKNDVVLDRKTMQRFDLHIATISARQELENQDDVEALSTTTSPNGTS